jgi:hypothetical protein
MLAGAMYFSILFTIYFNCTGIVKQTVLNNMVL